ncbi:biotin/lipoyl-binding protein [Christensenella timonensis]|uniref:biotin/lipoyl-binding protein n=1 Tax=Christensenella timonensis TaxID=1816678 RepID=UPI00082A4A93|nr:biotin/lipoyl-binding protein [Christensenella timonensis]
MSKNKKNKKMTKKKWIVLTAIIAAAVLLAVFLVPGLFRPDASAMASIMQTATVETGTIETTVVGSGNLATQETADIKIPSGVTVESVLVEAGDTVAEGDTLATLDPASVKAAISDTQSTLSSLDSQIDSAKDESSSRYITTYVSGRIKQIFAEEGMDTQSTINASGSLVVLSIDGKMKVTFQPAAADTVSSGSSVVVTLSDGTTKTGTVTSLSAGSCTVTLTDNGPTYGDTVNIAAEDGTQLGTGTLEINAPIHILGNGGTVASVDVSLNESVGSGATLITLQEAGASEEYASLLAERTQYEDVLRTLLQYEQTNTITAKTAGTVSSVSISGTSDSSATDSSSSSAQSLSATGTPAVSMASGSLETAESSILLLSAAAQSGSNTIPLADPSTDTIIPISGITEIYINNPVTGNTPQSTIMPGNGYTGSVSIDELDIMSVQEGQDVTIVLDALPEETFHGTVSKISASGNIQSGVTTYPVTITLTDVGDAAVMAGMNATATISIATSENVLLIPLDALQESGSEKFVLVAGSPDGESGMSERRTVETGLSDGTNVEITSGLSEGEQIIYEQSASTDSSGQSTFPGGGMGGMPGGGVEMPSGGGMPGGTGGGPMGS